MTHAAQQTKPISGFDVDDYMAHIRTHYENLRDPDFRSIARFETVDDAHIGNIEHGRPLWAKWKETFSDIFQEIE